MLFISQEIIEIKHLDIYFFLTVVHLLKVLLSYIWVESKIHLLFLMGN